MQSPGDSNLTVTFDLPPGWAEVPTSGERPRGLLRRNPYEVVARRFVSSGAVVQTLIPATTRFLERVAAGDPGLLALAALVRAPGPQELTFATVGVLAGPAVGSVPLEDLASRPIRPDEGDRSQQGVDLPWGRAVRAAFTVPAADGAREPGVQYWVEPNGIDRIVVLSAGIHPPAGQPADDLVDQVDELAKNLTIGYR